MKLNVNLCIKLQNAKLILSYASNLNLTILNPNSDPFFLLASYFPQNGKFFRVSTLWANKVT